ncbi:MFS transporter, partial [Cronobacter dublinensis subsp. dublinensis]|nr:MFS transporter [Cronobacter dublinensis subsp. dublinensis]
MSANPFSRTANAAAALSVLSAAMILPLSFTGGVATTPAIGHELGGSALSLAWLTNGFMLTFGSSLLAAGVIADLTGRKRIFIGGLMLFFVSCLA